jgi:transcriptional regulator with XRE-family HTH domain
MHVQRNAQRVRDEVDKEDVGFVITLQDLGRYLQNLRENRRVTQASLSTKTGAMAGRKISRSRISEIENAKRDPIAERELRVYMVGLKCAPHHIDRMVKALRQCAATPPRETPADPVPSRPAIPDPYLGGLGDADDDRAPREEKFADDPTTGGDEKEGHERLPQEDTCIDSLDASRPQPRRRCWQRHRIALAAATTLIMAVFTGLNAMFFLRRESVAPSTSLGSPAVLVASPNVPPKVPTNVPPISEDTSNLSKSVSLPSGVPAQVDKWSAKTSKTRDRLPPGNAASRDTTQQGVGYCCVVLQHGEGLDPVSLPRIDQQKWRTYTVQSGGARSGPAGEQSPVAAQ